MWPPKWLADWGLRLNRLYYKRLFERNYLHKGSDQPSWFDHRIDLYYNWPHNLFWLERGILPRKLLFKGCTVLSLFCGDGFYARHFHSGIAGRIDAVDRDPAAIAHARKWHAHPVVRYYEMDAVTHEFPADRYDVVLWFEGLEHLSDEHAAVVLGRIKKAIGQEGVLFGSTPLVPKERQGLGNVEHQHEFATPDEARARLLRDFAEVQIDVTVYPLHEGGERRTAYFTARRPRT